MRGGEKATMGEHGLDEMLGRMILELWARRPLSWSFQLYRQGQGDEQMSNIYQVITKAFQTFQTQLSLVNARGILQPSACT